MIEAVLFNWSGTLSDYGGRGREAWYQPLAARRPACSSRRTLAQTRRHHQHVEAWGVVVAQLLAMQSDSLWDLDAGISTGVSRFGPSAT